MSAAAYSLENAQRKLLNSESLAAWSCSVHRNGQKPAIVAGTFDILQPGNFHAIRRARQASENVCIVVEPDDLSLQAQNRAWAWHSLAVRMEFVAHLRDVAAVTTFPSGHGSEFPNSLAPFTLVDCFQQKSVGPLSGVLRKTASAAIDVPPVNGCFTTDISEALRGDRTPIHIPVEVIEQTDPPATMDRLLLDRSQSGQRIVTVNGCFDILHIGHLQTLAKARLLGDLLVILVNDDESVRVYKGPTRPVYPAVFRLAALCAMESVSLALAFSGDNPLCMLERIRPDIHVKGGTYVPDRVRQERELLESWGGRLAYCDLLPGYSTSGVIGKMTASG